MIRNGQVKRILNVCRDPHSSGKVSKIRLNRLQVKLVSSGPNRAKVKEVPAGNEGLTSAVSAAIK